MTDKQTIDNRVLPDHRSRAEKYLSFSLAGKEYGIGILSVKEIIGRMPIVPVPRTPEHIKGVVNLRDKVIPVMDLGLRFGIPETRKTEKSCIIITENKSSNTPVTMGILADSVSEVLNIGPEEIETPQVMVRRENLDFVLGFAKTGQGLKILLDMDSVLSAAPNFSKKRAA